MVVNVTIKHINKLPYSLSLGFRPGDSTMNQLLYLVHEILEAFEDPSSLEVRTVFIGILRLLIKFGMKGRF